jgi:hypothetical protein
MASRLARALRARSKKDRKSANDHRLVFTPERTVTASWRLAATGRVPTIADRQRPASCGLSAASPNFLQTGPSIFPLVPAALPRPQSVSFFTGFCQQHRAYVLGIDHHTTLSPASKAINQRPSAMDIA